MKNKRLVNTFFYITLSFFLIDWIFIYTIFYTDSNTGWWLTVSGLFLSFIAFYVYILLSHEKRKNMVLGLIIFLSAIFLARQRALQAVPFFVIAYFFYWVAISRRIKKEQFGRIRVEPYRILKRGRFYIILAVSLMIAVGFYFSMINNQKYVEAPHFEIQVPEFVGSISVWILNFITPRHEIDNSTTVDEFIMQNIENQATVQTKLDSKSGTLPTATTSEHVVEETRNNLSQQLGVELMGDETLSQMVSIVLSKWINTTINVEVGESKAAPVGASIALGLTLYALFWLASFLQFWVAWGILIIFEKRGKIEVLKKRMEVERIT